MSLSIVSVRRDETIYYPTELCEVAQDADKTSHNSTKPDKVSPLSYKTIVDFTELCSSFVVALQNPVKSSKP